EGINELYDGSKKLADGLSLLDGNSSSLTEGAEKLFSMYLAEVNSALAELNVPEILTADNYGDILDQYIEAYHLQELALLKESLDGLKGYCEGISEYTYGVGSARDGGAKLSDGISELKKETDKLLDELFTVDIDNLTEFIKAEDNPRIAAAAGDMQMDKSVGLIAGIIVMALFTYVISVFVIHQIQQESSVIGALYALGVKKSNLIGHYITLPTLISFAGGLVGSALGFSDVGIPVQVADSYAYFSLPQLSTAYPLYLIIYGVIMPPAVCALVNVLVINKRLSRTALSLMRNEQNTGLRSGVDLKNMGFLRRFQIRQMLREARTGLTIVFGMTISLMVFMLALNCFVLCENIKNDTIRDTSYEYMYTLKYPPEEVPEGAEACYAESFTKSAFDYTLDVSVIGVDSDNKYYGVTPEKGKSKITASASAAQKYGLKVGDKFILTDSAEDMNYAFTVTDIADYSVGLSVFMDIDSMRELFGREEDYYNMLLSDKALDIPEGRLYSVTSRSDTERSAAVFADLMMPMVMMFSVVSAIIFFVVMYMMMNVMIDRAAFGISLVKIFGYRTKEVRRLYLNGNTIVVAVGALIAIPVSKLAMDAIYPYAVSNVACGLNIAFPWYYYVLIFAGVMLIYFAVNAMLVRKLKNISPAEVLKNRE
ncbi:MAG: FtsX-like permease family protein, partial [Ruminiclostridium sp.]